MTFCSHGNVMRVVEEPPWNTLNKTSIKGPVLDWKKKLFEERVIVSISSFWYCYLIPIQKQVGTGERREELLLAACFPAY